MTITPQMISGLLARHPSLSLLVIAYAAPQWMYSHAGRVLFLGTVFPDQAAASADFHFIAVRTQHDIQIALRGQLGTASHGPFDVVFINHEHSLQSLVQQLAAVFPMAGPDGIILLDGAYPPDIGMAGSSPTQDWWVGEVWMLQHLLRPAGERFHVLCSPLPPVGLLAVRDACLPAAAEIELDYQRLSSVSTTEQLHALITHSDAGTFESWLARALEALERTHGMVFTACRSLPSVRHREVDPPRERWTKRLPEFVADLSKAGHDTAQLWVAERNLHGKSIDTFKGAWLTGCNSLLQEGCYFDRNSCIGDQTLAQIADAYGTLANQGTNIRRHEGQFVIPRSKLRNATAVGEAIIFGGADEPDNWGMWLLLGLPSVAEFKANRSRYGRFMTRLAHPWQRSVLSELGLLAGDIMEHDANRTYWMDDVTIIRHTWRDLSVSPSDEAIYADLAEHCSASSTTSWPERIFVSRLSRTRAGAYRGLVNEPVLVEALEGAGFSVVEPERMPFLDQVAMFRAAKVVVGLGGAGMFNTVFCQPESLVISIESGMQFAPSHTNLFASKSLRYGVVLGQQDPSDPSLHQRRWTLDIPAALACILKHI